MVAAIPLRRRWLFISAFSVLLAVQIAAQQTPPPTPRNAPPLGDPVFKATVRRVIVDVVVSDSLGRPVSGLSAADFAIAEDGAPQPLRAFDVHDFDSISDSLPTLPASLPANTFLNVPRGPERGPLYLLLLDLLNMEISDQPAARAQLLNFIRNKPMGTRFAIFVLSDRLYLVQGFTEDRSVLLAAVDPKNPRSGIPKIFLNADNYRPYVSTPGVLANIGQYLRDLPGHKNLIWFSGSFPSTIMPSSDSGSEALSVSDQIREATDSLAQARVAVYPVDVRGVVATGPTASAGKTPGTGDGLAGDEMLNAGYMTEEEIAFATGGRAFHDTNDLAGALSAATETGGRYYTLTYSPSNQNYDGRLRHIRVEMEKKGYRLEYRRSYYGSADWSKREPAKEKSPSELQPLAVSRPSDSLVPNLQHGAPVAHQLLFRAHIHTLAPPAKATREQMEKLAEQAAQSADHHKGSGGKTPRPVQLQTYQIDYTIAARYPLLEIAAAAYDDDGKILNAAVQRVIEEAAQFSAAKNGGAIYRVQQQFDVPVNATSVRVAVRDVATDNVGALEIKLPLAPDGSAISGSEPSDIPPSKTADAGKPQ
jgi:VWFA-related protein